ncbi:hypothetical protein H696_01414 [Fonticula alba]|uniref:Glutaredoxin domain-containing protein n=1 Tax=Fonticula alba TaxID=691883 RepID=A0A058ZEW5_FONAL|nr:hypothetical protein H696_01414 [Fonticula alba]KCV72007.1 hypothetical protein H696_01414 [Fonticula alba]|eukprot:XP_009493585.1 hypothetical protein H696_01414 [Fonticula alba]
MRFLNWRILAPVAVAGTISVAVLCAGRFGSVPATTQPAVFSPTPTTPSSFATMASAAARSLISRQVNLWPHSAPIVVVSKTYCPYCVAAIKLLNDLGKKANTKPVIHQIDLDGHSSIIQDTMASDLTNGHRTVPMVFIGTKFVGGNSDIQDLHKKGKLLPLIEAAVAAQPPGRSSAFPAVTPAAPPVEALVEKVKDWPAAGGVVAVTKSFCPYSLNAKELLRDSGARPVIYEIDFEEEEAGLQDALAASVTNGHRTVPMIFIGGKFIGGYSDLSKLNESGELRNMVAAAQPPSSCTSL